MKYLKKYIILIFLFACISVQGFALSLSDLRTQMRIILKDTSSDTNKQRWSDTQLNDILNIAQQNVFALTWCLHGSTITAISAGVREYGLPSDAWAIERVTIDNEIIEELSYAKLDEANEDWEGATSSATPTSYYTRPNMSFGETYWAIGFDPLPESSATLKIFYYQIPTDLSEDTDIPFNDYLRLTPFNHLIILYATYWTKFIEGNIQEAQMIYQQYAIEIKNLEASIDKKPNYFPSISGRRK